MKTIKVSGIGKISAFPDLVIISFEIYENGKAYDKCADKMNERIHILYDDIIKSGFKKSDLKTQDLKIETIYDNDKIVKAPKGYSAKTKLSLEFEYQKEKLNELILILTKSNANPVFNIDFDIKDKEAIKNYALESAVAHCKKKAEIIANSLGVVLGDVINVDYNTEEKKYQTRSRILYASSHRASENFEIEPSNIITTDVINVLWEIK